MYTLYAAACITLYLIPYGYFKIYRWNSAYVLIIYRYAMHYGISLIANLILEYGIYVTEQSRFTYFNYSSLLLVAFAWTELFISRAGLRWALHTKIWNNFRSERFWMFVALFAMTILVANYALSDKMYLSPTISKFNYLPNSRLYFIIKYFGNISSFIPVICGYLYFMNRRRLFGLVFIIYVFYLLAAGHKMTSLATMTLLFILPYLILNYRTVFDIIWQNRFKLATAFVALIGLNTLSYLYYNPYAGEHSLALMATFYRIAIHPHIWWGSVNELSNINYTSIYDLLYGMKTLMREVANTTTVMEYSGRYTFGYPSILVYLFPLSFAFMLNIPVVLYRGLMIGIAINGIRKGYIWPYVLAMQIVTWNRNIFSMADFYLLYSPKYILVIILLIVAIISPIALTAHRKAEPGIIG